ncbi:DUF5788 family protein [Halobaculum marinum]|uniref:DUF5788 family protein n=1 Tax=Halobaculum marinum TaxID=3031996 RepID=A0ABD5WWR1_9EURY|nr:DUF5788 family protein [Halobaculum sp. DT55]
MEKHERHRFLDRLRGGSTLGAEMADTVEVDGTTVDLTALVFELRDLDAVPERERERVDDLLGHLRRERIARRRRIEEADITAEEGEALAAEVIGLDRAINALESLDDASYGEQARRSHVEGHKEFLGLVNQLR